MAQYNITYSCGHTGTVELFGKTSNRDRKIDWYENCADCPDCYKIKMREKQAKEPIIMQVSTNGLDKDQSGNIIAEIAILGGTINLKDEIKNMGYRWHDLRGGIMDMLSAKRPAQAWCKTLPIIKIGNSPEWTEITREAESLGAEIKIKIDPISFELAAKNVTDKRAADERIAQLIKPTRPACHPRALHPEGRWNGTYYGKPGNRNYYVDDTNYTLMDDEYKACMVYRDAFNAYKVECDNIRKGGK